MLISNPRNSVSGIKEATVQLDSPFIQLNAVVQQRTLAMQSTQGHFPPKLRGEPKEISPEKGQVIGYLTWN